MLQTILIFVGIPLGTFVLITLVVVLTTERNHVPEGLRRADEEQGGDDAYC
jgi:hypothetical protein